MKFVQLKKFGTKIILRKSEKIKGEKIQGAKNQKNWLWAPCTKVLSKVLFWGLKMLFFI